MTCAACVSSVEKAVTCLDGVEFACVSLMTNSLEIEYDPEVLSPEDIIKAVKNKGYSAEPFVRGKKEDSTEDVERMKLRFIVSLSFMIPLMYISMASMLGLPLPSIISNNFIVFGALQFGLCSPIVAVNYKFFTIGFKRLIKLDPNMDSLIATGSGASLIYSLYAYVKMATLPVHAGHYHLYVDSAAMILTLITLGKFLEARARRKTSGALQNIVSLSPEFATVLKNGSQKRSPPQSLRSVIRSLCVLDKICPLTGSSPQDMPPLTFP